MNAYEALNLMQTEDVATLLVVEGEKIRGVLTSQDLLKVVSLKLELEKGTEL